PDQRLATPQVRQQNLAAVEGFEIFVRAPRNPCRADRTAFERPGGGAQPAVRRGNPAGESVGQGVTPDREFGQSLVEAVDGSSADPFVGDEHIGGQQYALRPGGVYRGGEGGGQVQDG